MKPLLLKIGAAALLGLSVFTFSATPQTEARSYRTKASNAYVHGYYRKNGTYVAPYYRSKSDGYTYNNYVCLDHGRCR